MIENLPQTLPLRWHRLRIGIDPREYRMVKKSDGLEFVTRYVREKYVICALSVSSRLNYRAKMKVVITHVDEKEVLILPSVFW
jgi:hypothetical protein